MSVGRKATTPETQPLGTEPSPPLVRAPTPGPGCPTTSGLLGQRKSSAGRLGSAALPACFRLPALGVAAVVPPPWSPSRHGEPGAGVNGP